MNYTEAMQDHNDSLWNADQENVCYSYPHVFEYKLHNGKVIVTTYHRDDGEVRLSSVEYKGVNILPIIDEEEIPFIVLESQITFKQ